MTPLHHPLKHNIWELVGEYCQDEPRTYYAETIMTRKKMFYPTPVVVFIRQHLADNAFGDQGD